MNYQDHIHILYSDAADVMYVFLHMDYILFYFNCGRVKLQISGACVVIYPHCIVPHMYALELV